ncbi:cobalamin biosynthesis CobD domain protein [Rhodococcus sp. MTM3W5.2]|nr:cobalamin biosynthesis CobD domain protein [Rhodococcus sp. MTM3W5.2]
MDTPSGRPAGPRARPPSTLRRHRRWGWGAPPRPDATPRPRRQVIPRRPAR